MTNMSIQPLWLTHFIEILLVLELQLTKTYFGTFSYKAHFRPQISSNGGKSPSISRRLDLNILLVLKWHSFNTQALFNAIFSPLLSLTLVMPPLFEPSTVFLVSSSASILSLFTKCKCSSKLCFLPLICVLFFR